MTEIIMQTVINVFVILFYFIYLYLLGSLFNHRNSKTCPIEIIFERNVIGIFSLINFLYVWHNFFPINNYAFLTTTLPIVIKLYSILSGKKISASFFHNLLINANVKIFLIILGILLFWIANIGIRPIKYEPMYYIQLVRWAQNFPLIPGLANLFDHFGFDSSIFIQIAYFDNLFFLKTSFWNYSAYLLIMGFLYIFIIPLKIILFNKSSIKSYHIMSLLCLPILIHYCFYGYPAISSDLPIIIFSLIIAIEFYKIIFYSKKDYNLIFVLLAIGFSSKMSFSPIFGMTIIMIIIYNRNYIYHYVLSNKKLFASLIFVISLQLYRNFVLSGYLLYPNPSISFPVKWKVPKENVITLNKKLSQWPANFQWGVETPEKIYYKQILTSKFFTQHRRIESLYPTILAIVGFILILLDKNVSLKKLIIFTFPALAQILFFIFKAPHGRFASFAFWWIASAMLSFTLFKLFKKNKQYLITFIIILVIGSFSFHTFDFLGSEKNIFIDEIDNYKNSKPASPQYSIFTTDSGLKINVPINGKRCYDCPLPCTSLPNKNLKLIDNNFIESGFFIE